MKRALIIAARAGIAVGAIVAGVVVLMGLVASKPEPQHRVSDDRGLLVDTREVEPGSREVTVEAQGLVVPAEQVTIQAEVTGRVTWLNPKLVAGGRLDKGEVLVRIDPRDYKLQVEVAAAEIERARVELELERGRKQVAEREWKILGDDSGADGAARARALREPQIKAARNMLAAAKSGKRRAQLMVEKTVIRAPFNALVVSESVGAGQLVAPQAPIATLVDTDRFWVQTSVPTAQLAAIAIPGINAEPGAGARAVVSHDTGAGTIETTGTVVRLLGDLDPAGQMARVIVAIDDPLALGKGDRQPMLLGSHVQLSIDAGTLSDVIEVPRTALRDGDEVFVMEGEELQVRPVEVAWRTDRSVYVAGGLDQGDRVVLSSIAAPVPGMKLRADLGGDDGELAHKSE
jgi:RND family efflux transporter MFP subunit